MRKITHIVIHCTATPAGKEVSVKEIDRWHRARGFAKIGYHYIIHLDGSVSVGRKEEEAGAHVAGHNATTIGISYVGGVDANDVNKARDTRTDAQKFAMARLVGELLARYPGAEVLGHRDFPGVAKACPCFDARAWWQEVSAAPKEARTLYIVQHGDTLYSIAKDNGITLGKLVEANPGVDPKTLSVGMLLVIP